MIKFNFTNKTVIVTGGGTGIGSTIAEYFLACGANVVIAGRRKEVLNRAINEVVKKNDGYHGRIMATPCDMSLESSINELTQRTLEQFKRLDIFINNSGVWSLNSIFDLTDDEVVYSFNNILKSTILGTKVSAQSMKSGCVIINIGSFAGLMAMKNASLYSSFKSGVISFTKSAASELASLKIRVNCIIPGVIRTPMTSEHIDQHHEQIIKPIPLKRVGKAEEVANGVLFLSSSLASYITGACLEITGGKYSTQM